MLSFEQQNQNPNASAQSAQSQPQMRLRDDIPQINQPAQRNGRKRKSPPTNPDPQPPPPPPAQPQSQQTAAPQNLQHVLPAHLIHHSFPFAGPPPGTDYTPAGIPPQPNPPHQNPSPSQDVQHASPQQQQQQQQQQPQSPAAAGAGRQLSNSKRAEQNRKAQRAFRERRDQHVKALESRSQLLDAALASADEANRRWEECRALVDQLRVENATLRAALSQHVQVLPIPTVMSGQEQAQKAEGENKPESGETGVKSD